MKPLAAIAAALALLFAAPAAAKVKHPRTLAPRHEHLIKHPRAVDAVVHIPAAALVKRKPTKRRHR